MLTLQTEIAKIHPRLTALSAEVSALARSRPLVPAPAGLTVSAARLLRDLNSLQKHLPPEKRAPLPALPHPKRGQPVPEITFGELAALLAEARALTGALAQLNNVDPSRRPKADISALRAKLAARIDEINESGRIPPGLDTPDTPPRPAPAPPPE